MNLTRRARRRERLQCCCRLKGVVERNGDGAYVFDLQVQHRRIAAFAQLRKRDGSDEHEMKNDDESGRARGPFYTHHIQPLHDISVVTASCT